MKVEINYVRSEIRYVTLVLTLDLQELDNLAV